MIGYLDLFNDFNQWSFVDAYISEELNKEVWNNSNEVVRTLGVDNIGKRKQNYQFPYGKYNTIAYDINKDIYEWSNDYINEYDKSKRNQSLIDFIDDLKYKYELNLLEYKMEEIENLEFYINLGVTTEFECVYKKSPNNIEFIVTERFLIIRDKIENETCVIYNEKDLKSKNINIIDFIQKNKKLILNIMNILNFPSK